MSRHPNPATERHAHEAKTRQDSGPIKATTAYQQGQADHANGKPRIPLFARPMEEWDAAWAASWQAGWDAANLAD